MIDINPNIPPPITPPIGTGETGQADQTTQTGQAASTPMQIGDGTTTGETTQSFALQLTNRNGVVALQPPGNDSSLLAFLESVGERLKELRHVLNDLEVFDHQQQRGTTIASLATTFGLAAMRMGMSEQHAPWEAMIGSLNQNAGLQNLATTAHNAQVLKPGGDADQAALMNAAVKDYRNGEISPQEFEAITKNYNEYVDQRNSEINSYNETVNDYNSQINGKNYEIRQLNRERENVGLPPLPLESYLPEAKQMDEMDLRRSRGIPMKDQSLVDTPTLQPVILEKTAPSLSEMLNTHYGPIHSTVMFDLQSLNNLVDLARANMEAMQFLLPGMDIVLPNAYINKMPQALLGAALAVGAASGLSTLTGISSIALERIMARSLFTSAARRFGLPQAMNLFDKINSFSLSMMNRLGVSTAMHAANLLGDRLAILSQGSFPMRATLALSFTSSIRNLVVSNSINRAVREFVQGAVKEAAEDLGFGRTAGLTRSLSASVKLSMMTMALSQLGGSLGLPGLLPNLLSNVSGISASSLALAGLTSLSTIDALGNAMTRGLVGLSLSNRLEQFGFDSDSAASIAGAVINGQFNGSINSDRELRRELYHGFRDQGLSKSMSKMMANNAMHLLRDEASMPFLDTAFALAAFNQNNLVSALANTLIFGGMDASPAAALLNGALSGVMGNSFSSMREFRDDLQLSLQLTGVGRRSARRLANQAAEFLTRGSIGMTFGNAVLNHVAGASSIASDLVNQGVSPMKAQGIANDIMERTTQRGPFSSEDDMKNALRHEINSAERREGINIRNERDMRENVVANIEIANVMTNPLMSMGLGVPLSLSDLLDNLYTHVHEQLLPTLGGTMADKIALELIDLLLGSDKRELDEIDLTNPNSVLNIMADLLEQSIGELDAQADAEAYMLFRAGIIDTPEAAIMSALGVSSAEAVMLGLLGTTDAGAGGISIPHLAG